MNVVFAMHRTALEPCAQRSHLFGSNQSIANMDLASKRRLALWIARHMSLNSMVARTALPNFIEETKLVTIPGRHWNMLVALQDDDVSIEALRRLLTQIGLEMNDVEWDSVMGHVKATMTIDISDEEDRQAETQDDAAIASQDTSVPVPACCQAFCFQCVCLVCLLGLMRTIRTKYSCESHGLHNENNKHKLWPSSRSRMHHPRLPPLLFAVGKVLSWERNSTTP